MALLSIPGSFEELSAQDREAVIAFLKYL